MTPGYQWGLLIRRDGGPAAYEPIVSFDPLLDDADERALADAFVTKVSALIDEAQAAGQTIRIFHWSHPELSMIRKFPEAHALVEAHHLDLLAWCKGNVFARDGYSIKHVAPALGFHWPMSDAGGANSQVMATLARLGDETAQEWCLAYNKADVEAQAAIRDGLRQLR